MVYEERRSSSGRRLMKDRRQHEFGLISGYANYTDYSGPNRRGAQERRERLDRRAVGN